MAKKAKSIKKNNKRELMIVNPNAAGIDIASTEYQVCVPEDRDKDNNRCFDAYTCDLYSIVDFLRKCKIDTVGMEATGIYWVQLFFVLQDAGFDVVLANARHVKNIGDKKTDVVDASWIQLLHSYGLLPASFQADNLSKQLRNLVRHRNTLTQSAAKEVLHIQKSLELMNIKIHKVISDILGKSGTNILQAIIDGERDPEKLAAHRDLRIRASKEDIIKSLEGIWCDDQLFILKKSFELYNYFKAQMNEYDTEIKKITERYTTKTGANNLVKSNKKRNQKNDLNFDAENIIYKIYGVNVTRIPGINNLTAMKLLSELGVNFTKKFEYREDKFCSWANVVPNTKKSGGKIISSKVPKKKNMVGQILRMSASTLKNSKSELGVFFRRKKANGGYKYAVVATANKLGRIFFSMVLNQTEYDENKLKVHRQDYLKKRAIWLKEQLKQINEEVYTPLIVSTV